MNRDSQAKLKEKFETSLLQMSLEVLFFRRFFRGLCSELRLSRLVAVYGTGFASANFSI